MEHIGSIAERIVRRLEKERKNEKVSADTAGCDQLHTSDRDTDSGVRGDVPVSRNFVCSACHKEVGDDEIADFENEMCHDCHEEWCARQIKYWKPLYDGEKRAGLLKEENDDR